MKFNSNVLSLGATLAALAISNAGVASARAVAPRANGAAQTIPRVVRRDEMDDQLKDWGMVRNDDGTEDSPSGAFSGNEEFGAATWQRFTIAPDDEHKDEYKGGDETIDPERIISYNVVANEDGSGALDIRFVETKDKNLPDDAKRRNFIKNGFIKAGGDMTKLKIVGDTDIIEDEVRESIMKGLDEKEIEPVDEDDDEDPIYDDQTVTFTENGKGWGEVTNNVFIGGLTKIFEETEGMNNHRITEIVVMIREEKIFDMRTFISPPPGGDGEEGDDDEGDDDEEEEENDD